MIQDIAPHKLNNQYGQKKAPDAGSRFLYYDGRKVLVRKGIGGNENQIAYPTYEELKKCMPKDVAEDTEYTYLFAVDDKSYYLGKKEKKKKKRMSVYYLNRWDTSGSIIKSLDVYLQSMRPLQESQVGSLPDGIRITSSVGDVEM